MHCTTVIFPQNNVYSSVFFKLVLCSTLKTYISSLFCDNPVVYCVFQLCFYLFMTL